MWEPIPGQRRPIGVGPRLLAALTAVALLTGCAGGDVVTAAPSTPAPTTSTASPAPESSGAAATPATTAPPPGGAGAPTTGATVWPTGEVPHDPMQRTLTGTVQRAGGCTVLVVGERRWPLTGALAGSLTVGSRMTVTGNLAALPESCANEAGPALDVTHAAPA